jgi:hypothetical protein
MASDPRAPGASVARTANCVACDRDREHTVCSVLHLVDAGWVMETCPHGPALADAAPSVAMARP